MEGNENGHIDSAVWDILTQFKWKIRQLLNLLFSAKIGPNFIPENLKIFI